ncbi:hypothetical protein GCM10010109_63690 [Actinoplanes campanulatus]|nr:hypothetical protein GCM10010109_63690 [Actinoplanes campanulatus]GID40820.1 hypothetical protein Aca09nite_73260 [Actinoplanes campanulatus]
MSLSVDSQVSRDHVDSSALMPIMGSKPGNAEAGQTRYPWLCQGASSSFVGSGEDVRRTLLAGNQVVKVSVILVD